MQKKKNDSLLKRAKLLAGALVVVAVFGAGSVVANVGSLWDKIAQVAGVVVGRGLLEQAPADNSLSEVLDVLGAGVTGSQGAIRPQAERKDVTNFTEIGLLPSTSTPKMVVHMGAEVGSIGVGSSTFAVLRNMSGQSIYIERCGVKLNGTTSSTTRFSMGTSSNAGGLDFNAGNEARNCLDRVEAATSTVSYFRSSGLFNLLGGASSEGLMGHGNGTSTLLELRDGTYLVGHMTTGGSNAIQGSSATSSAGRGFDANSFWFVEYRMFSTGTPRD